MRRFKGDQAARTELADTLAARHRWRREDFDAVFYVGGHGALWDLPEDRISQALIAAVQCSRKADRAGWPWIQLRCDTSWMAAAVRWSRVAASRHPQIQKKRQWSLIDSLPFLLQDELVRLGGLYSKGARRHFMSCAMAL
mgnify:CR=1 FL=1